MKGPRSLTIAIFFSKIGLMIDINYWLLKSEPSSYSFDTLKKENETIWDGVRNYQARNLMRNMSIGDKAFFYHSNCKIPGIVGIVEIIAKDIIDPTQFDKNSKYYDPKSDNNFPRWDCVRVKYIRSFERIISLNELKNDFSSEEFKLVKKGNRLSVIDVPEKIAKIILSKVD
tara:strand:+ start:435 stop:950 length:516 start_codon:yes stop_codon:yes gene_type:complete